jgi:hypothetical protein
LLPFIKKRRIKPKFYFKYFQTSRPRLPVQTDSLPGFPAHGPRGPHPAHIRRHRRVPGRCRPSPEKTADVSGRQWSSPAYPGYDSFKPIVLWQPRVLTRLLLRLLNNKISYRTSHSHLFRIEMLLPQHQKDRSLALAARRLRLSGSRITFISIMEQTRRRL